MVAPSDTTRVAQLFFDAQETVLQEQKRIKESLTEDDGKWLAVERHYKHYDKEFSESHFSHLGPSLHKMSGHRQIIAHEVSRNMEGLFKELRENLQSLGGYFTDVSKTQAIGIGRGMNDKMHLHLMGYNIYGSLTGTPKSWALPRMLDDLRNLPEPTAIYKIGNHKVWADSPDTVVKISLTMSSPKTPWYKRKKTKNMATIERIWSFEEVMNIQYNLLGLKNGK